MKCGQPPQVLLGRVGYLGVPPEYASGEPSTPAATSQMDGLVIYFARGYSDESLFGWDKKDHLFHTQQRRYFLRSAGKVSESIPQVLGLLPLWTKRHILLDTHRHEVSAVRDVVVRTM